jgi:uncharacterized protein
VSVYLDASILVSLFTSDALTGRADRLLRNALPRLIVSDFAAAEFASAIARRVRVGDLMERDARTAFAAFDEWTTKMTRRSETTTADIASATRFLRRLDLNLSTPDALNIAIAQRFGADLLPFDEKMAMCASTLGLTVVSA